MGIIIGVAVGIVFLVIVIPASMYNSLVRKRNQVENIFGSLDAMLKKRYDLIPNLVASVQQYMKHEKEILTEITNLRTKAVSGGLSSEETVQLNTKLGKALGGIMVAVENYPDLKANQNFLQLQAALNEVEEQISAARRAYNASVTDLNNGIEMFPTNIMAGMMRLRRKAVFEISETERGNVNVNSLFKG